MNTRIPENTLGAATNPGPAEAYSKAGHNLPRQDCLRNSADEERDDNDDAWATGASAPKMTVSTEDARHFEAAMRSAQRQSDSHEGDASSEQEAHHQKKKPEKQEGPADLSLASLFAGRFDGGALAESTKTDTAQAAQAAASSQRAEALAEHLAQRILVSEPSAAGQEVHIQLAGNILPDTEICLLRGKDGLLSAVIHTDNAAAFQTLAAAQHDLRERLEASEGQAVHVELRSSADDDNDPRRRSRGLDMEPYA